MDEEAFALAFLRYLRRRGHHLTQARKRIAEATWAMPDGPFDADALQAAVAGHGIARATVYRTLALLEEAGLVRRLVFPDRARFEVIPGGAGHGHLICDACGRIRPFRDPRIAQQLAELETTEGFRPRRHELRVWGVCADCREAE